ncbi:MAG: hypothetical protein NTW86_05840 [Candidatus Sumerlaeota bacterium]|nr:hypothetical protein [Candidatus Sumerlaeota bacterium]
MSIVSFLFLSAFAPRGLANADAALYAQQIEGLNINDRTIHIGYYLLGIPFTRISPFDVDFSLNLMNALFGALCVGLVPLIAYTLTGRLIPSIAASVALATHCLFVYHSAFAEVYVPQLFFFLLTAQLILRDRPIGAGLAFGCAFLATPSTILAAPFVALLRPRWRSMSFFALSFLALVGAVLFPHVHDFLLEERGLLKAVSAGIGPTGAIKKEFADLMGFSLFLVFVAAGLIRLALRPDRRLFGAALVCLWLFPFVLGEKWADVPVQLPLYAALAATAGVGLAAWADFPWRRAVALGTAVAIFGLGMAVSGTKSYLYVSSVSAQIDSYRTNVHIIAEAAKPGYVVVGRWSRGIVFEHYLFRRANTGVWINSDWIDGIAGKR